MIGELFAPIPFSILHRTDLSPRAKLLAGMLRFHAMSNGRAYPSLTTLCDELGLPRRSLIRAIQELEARGVIRVVRAATRGRTRTNTYVFVDKGASLAPIAEGKRCQPRPEKVPTATRKGATLAPQKTRYGKDRAPSAAASGAAASAQTVDPDILALNRRKRHEMALASKSGNINGLLAEWKHEGEEALAGVAAG